MARHALTVYLPRPLYIRLQAEKARSGAPMTELVRRAVEGWLAGVDRRVEGELLEEGPARG